jgi:hypothetical protein
MTRSERALHSRLKGLVDADPASIDVTPATT